MLAIGYAVLVGSVACWAWWVDIRLIDSPREHLLPDILLALLTLPSSITENWVYQRWPAFFTGLWQTAYITGCAVFQSGVFYMFSRWREKHGDT
jgi:uncharacterized membrane protein